VLPIEKKLHSAQAHSKNISNSQHNIVSIDYGTKIKLVDCNPWSNYSWLE